MAVQTRAKISPKDLMMTCHISPLRQTNNGNAITHLQSIPF